ncbi:SMI1/KNR4 family protein [Streptomyces sp. JNUCC 64]
MTDRDGDDRLLPPALAELARTWPFGHHLDGDGDEGGDGDDGAPVDFEPYEAFWSADGTTDWLREWTGNHELDGGAYRVFAQDGGGGQAALWLARPGAPLTGQPVVFVDSEGACGVVARNLSDFLWLLADGSGPLEVLAYEDHGGRPRPGLARLAGRYADPGSGPRPAREVTAAARAEFPAFADDFLALCRY